MSSSDAEFDRIIRKATDASLLAAAAGVVRPKKWLTKRDTIDRIGDVADATFDTWLADGKAPPSVGRGRLRRWDVDVIDAWLANGGAA